MMMNPGVFPIQEILRLVESSRISSTMIGWQPAIQPASLDLQLGNVAHRLRASFLPRDTYPIDYFLRELTSYMIPIPPEEGIVLERDGIYLIPLQEHLSLPSDTSASANPKSTTGRLDVFARLITASGRRFDDIPTGYCGPLFLEVSPRSFPIRVRPGSRLNQIRFRHGESSLSQADIVEELGNITGVGRAFLDGDGLVISVSLLSKGNAMAYRARKHTGVVDVDAVSAYNAEDFWDPLEHRTQLVLDPDEFYILASSEKIAVPHNLAGELIPIDAGLGEFRVHYAGFFDPGFGVGGDGVPTSHAVLEVRARDVPFVLVHGQPVARMRFERMQSTPHVLYGNGSNYQGQGLHLAKNFTDPNWGE